MNQQYYRQVISGQRRDSAAAVLRFLLSAATVPYSAAVRARNYLYDKEVLKSRPVQAVVISIGNITTGGTGKTPLVIWLYNFLRDKNINPAILTRGYKTGTRDIQTDEPALLASNCPDADIIVNPDRLSGAKTAVNTFGSKLLILDDGFQHRRLDRELDIVTIDATQPFGYGKILPAGVLREPLNCLRRADAVVLTHCEKMPDERIEKIENTIRKIKPNITIARSIHQPVSIQYKDGSEQPAEKLQSKKVYAFCGIANPESFQRLIENLGAKLTGTKFFNDHHRYSRSDLDQICRTAESLNSEIVLTTEKDWNKIAYLETSARLPLAFLKIQIQFTSAIEQFIDLIEKLLAVTILKR